MTRVVFACYLQAYICCAVSLYWQTGTGILTSSLTQCTGIDIPCWNTNQYNNHSCVLIFFQISSLVGYSAYSTQVAPQSIAGQIGLPGAFLSTLKALTHYKDFHKDFSKKIVGKIFVHIKNCWKNSCSCEKKL